METRKRRVLALAMAGVMAAACIAPSLAVPIGDGVTQICDEAYYATLDYYGNLLEGSVVKSYALNGAAGITDYGVYDEVVNLTDGTPVALGSGSASFQFSQSPGHFYFEGKTKAPFQNLPWTIALRYTLNGVPARAEDLAGQQGVVEITLDLVPNQNASSYARCNYTLEAMALFNQDDILSLEAPGAQVQLVGNLRTVLFMCLPGEEQHFTIRVGSNDFSFGGMTVLMVPATLSQLEEIAKLSQRKDDLEEDYEALSGSLDALLDALNDVQDGLYASASGLDQLDAARGTISRGKSQLYDDAGVLRGDLSSIAGLLEPVEQRTLALSQTITGSKAVLGSMTDTTVALQDQLLELEDALQSLERDASAVRRVIRTTRDMQSSLRSLQRALGSTSISGGSSDGSRKDLKDSVNMTKKVGSAYNETDRVEFMAKMLELQGQSASEIEGVRKLVGLDREQAEAMGVLAQWQAAQGAKQQTDMMYSAKDDISFQQFCGRLPGVDEKTAKQMSDLWTIYNSGPIEKAPGQTESPSETPEPQPEEPAPEDSSSGEPEANPAEPEPVPEEVPAPEEIPIPEESGDQEAGESSPDPAPASPDPAPTAPDPAPADSVPAGPDESQTVGGAAVDLIVGGLDDAMNQASARIDAIQSELNSTLNRITRPTGVVVGELAGLCGQLDDLIGLVDDAEDVSAALRQSSGEIRSILADVDSLRNILDEYEPTLQEGVANMGSLSASAVSALRDLETLLADTEALMKTSGSQLDDGTRQALRGLSATLRQTARAMAATGDVRDAKATINTIIEDTWREYTGDINNILMMDAGAEAVSLTDSRNPAPSSVQVLIRTQEIKVEEPTAEQLAASAPVKTTFWQRVAQMFQDFWRAVTGIFH